MDIIHDRYILNDRMEATFRSLEEARDFGERYGYPLELEPHYPKATAYTEFVGDEDGLALKFLQVMDMSRVREVIVRTMVRTTAN